MNALRWGSVVAFLFAVLQLPAHAADLRQVDAQVVARDSQGLPTFMSGALGSLQGGNRGAAAVDYLQDLVVEHFDADGSEGLVVSKVRRDDLGMVHVRVDQTIAGLPVIGAQLVVHAQQESGQVFAVNGRFVSAKGLPVKAELEAADALTVALKEFGLSQLDLKSAPDLVFVVGGDDQVYLAWRALVAYGEEVDYFFADAGSGALVARHPTIHRAKNWRTYDANNGTSLPGTLRCTNTGTCSDSVEQNIHNGASKIYDYYNAKFGRDSYTGSGATITSTAHYSVSYVNAFWNGSQLVFGDGNGSTSGPLGNAYDVVAHEFTHAVTSSESNLIYQGESGALNEGLSDVFAAAAEAYDDGSVNANTWKIGEDTWTPGTSGDALRYMNNPTQDGSSRDYYPERYTGSSDNGGVHINSGIANLAFYLLVQGGTHPRGKTTVNVTGIGMTKAEQIFYRAQTNYLTSSSNFQAARNATAQAAADLYGSSSAEVTQVHNAWCAVGVPGCPGSGPPPGSCPTGFTTYTGTISSGQSLATSGVSTSGNFQATLTGSAPDVDLYLERRTCSTCSWSIVARSESASSNESINYTSSLVRTYRWRLFGYSGNNISFTLCARPAL